MNDVKLARTSSDECKVQEVKTQKDSLLDLCNQILLLLNTKLSDNSILVLQEELRFMQRSSYYLEIQREDLLPSVDQNQQTLHLSDNVVLSLVDHQMLQRAMIQANTQVRLLLSVLGMLYEEIIRGCRELEAFVVKYYQGSVDSDTAASVQHKLQKTHRYVDDFQSRLTRNLGPLELQNRLIPNTCSFTLPHLSASLTVKMPVIFDRFKSRVSSTTAHLFWEVTNEQSKEPQEQFEIHGRSLPPNSPDHGQLTVTTSQSYNIQVNNLLSDTYYQFSVKRVDTVNLVYALWVDTIILKTLDISK